MIYGKLQSVIIMKIYGSNGEFLGEQAKYIYKPLLMWYDVVIGLILAFIIGSQMIMR
jgi:hypothetical protein